ncbi:DCC1-like thiol-disulfide oxidoreductase family protein [Peredibacter sp. HCB2-198]|uniref:DCC1-like thiol-disulfide oxidoreductase family protein n=1 Tax=Peredibacter sp. HCB2-198 TaxID=3383025 RepID=UPI0038B62357
MSVLQLIKKTFSFDDRSLALYRVLIGFIIMADVIYRLPDLTNFYTDIGLVPRALFMNEMGMPWSFSFHFANGSFAFAVIMFTINFIFGLMVFCGYKSNWGMLGAYIMNVSVHNRNWLVNNGGDDVLRAILFLSICLPLSRCFSVDAAMRKEDKKTTEFNSFWVLAFFFQVFAIYYVSYILKDHPIWRKEWTAIFYSSRLDIFATPIGIWMRNFPILGKISTAFTIYLEWLGPLLLLGAWLFGKRWWIVRTLIVVLFWGLHVGIFFTMTIGLFPFICIAMWSIFLPGPLWDRLAQIFRNREYDKLTMYYDGECGFCQKGARLIREFVLFRSVPIKVAQETPAIYSDMQKHHSWVIVNEKGERFFQYNAWIQIIKHSPFFYWSAGFFASKPVSSIGQGIYVWISHHRPFMGKATQFLEYKTEKKEIIFLKWLREAAGAFILIMLVMWNLTTIKKWNIKAPFWQDATRWIHLYQEWNMFAPYPKMDNVWVEIPGTLSDGTEMDVLTGNKDIYSIRDKEFYRAIPNEHWRKFYLNLSDRTDYARYYGGFLCRKWNDRKIRFKKNTTLRKFEIIVFSQPNLPDGGKGAISRKLSWRHWCFDEDYKRDNQGMLPPKP